MITTHLNTTPSVALIYVCFEDHSSLYSLLFYGALNFLLLPLYFSVLYVGLQQWRQRGAISIGNSDVFTYNLVLLEIIGSFAGIIFTAGTWAKSLPAIGLSFCLLVVTFIGQTVFHCEICFDRYLAVVHPISYRHLKEAKLVRTRNVCVVLTWLFSLSWIVPTLLLFPDFPSSQVLTFKGIFNVIVLFCCFSALYVLKRPGPNGQKQADQSKQRAFHIILTITCFLFFQFWGFFVYLCFFNMTQLTQAEMCLALALSILLIMPANALIPLLFLHRMNKLRC